MKAGSRPRSKALGEPSGLSFLPTAQVPVSGLPALSPCHIDDTEQGWPPAPQRFALLCPCPSLGSSLSPGRCLMLRAGAVPVPLAALLWAGVVGQALPAAPCHGGAPTGPSEPLSLLCPDSCCLLWSFVPFCILNAITLCFFALLYFKRKYHSSEQSGQSGSITNASAPLPPGTATSTCLSCTFITFSCMSCCWMVAPFPLKHSPLEVQSASVPMCAS